MKPGPNLGGPASHFVAGAEGIALSTEALGFRVSGFGLEARDAGCNRAMAPRNAKKWQQTSGHDAQLTNMRIWTTSEASTDLTLGRVLSFGWDKAAA